MKEQTAKSRTELSWGLILCFSLLILLLISGCSVGPKTNPPSKPNTKPTVTKELFKVGFVQAKSNLQEQNLTQSVEAALQKAANNLDLEYLVLQPGELSNEREAIDYLVNNGYQLIIGVGGNQVKAITQSARDYPDVTFAVIGDQVQLANVVSVNFREDQTAFLAGTLAALLSKTNIVGYIGGTNNPPNLPEKAFKAGVNYINKLEQRQVPIQVKVSYAGYFAKDLEKPAKGEALATAAIDAGADVLYHTAGLTGNGVIKVAADRAIKVIGSGFNQTTAFPGTVITSTTIKADQGIYQLLQEFRKGQLNKGLRTWGLKEQAVDLSGLSPGVNPLLTPELVTRLNEVKTQLSKGSLDINAYQVP